MPISAPRIVGSRDAPSRLLAGGELLAMGMLIKRMYKTKRTMENDLFKLRDKRILVAGHGGMVGSAVVRRLGSEGCDILTVPRTELDLTEQKAVEAWLVRNRTDVVVLAAAKVGGIAANNAAPAEFLTTNLQIQTNVIAGSFVAGVEKLLFLGSSCIYPKFAPQPIPEEALLGGPLEPTNQWYAIAKIAGLKMCQAYRRQYGADFISAMPTNLYGPGDNFDTENSHVLPALVRRFVDAMDDQDNEVEIWGTGTPLREFLHVDDLADALVFLLERYSAETPVNVGSGEETSILNLARSVARLLGYNGCIRKLTDKPDGPPRKLVDSSRLRSMGWRSKISLEEGLHRTIDEYRAAKSTGTIRTS